MMDIQEQIETELMDLVELDLRDGRIDLFNFIKGVGAVFGDLYKQIEDLKTDLAYLEKDLDVMRDRAW